MNVGLYQSAASLSALERWQEAVSQNITSSQTTGFRKRTVEFSAETAGNLNVNPYSKSSSGNEQPSIFTRATNGVSFSGGETEPTRNPLDVAIQGDGFFELKKPDGSLAYTRSGQFQMRADRTIVTAGDAELLTSSGTPVVMQPTGEPLTVNRDGTVFQGATSLGQLAIEKFANPGALLPAAGGLFTAGAGAGMSAVDKPNLMQGYLEQSNVQPLREMVDMVLISRAYEANQKIISTVDQQMEKTLQALG
jgi:flagellar basal body rod protein FlgG